MRVDERALAKRLGQIVAKRRAMCGLTQEDLGERLNVGNEAVYRLSLIHI